MTSSFQLTNATINDFIANSPYNDLEEIVLKQEIPNLPTIIGKIIAPKLTKLRINYYKHNGVLYLDELLATQLTTFDVCEFNITLNYSSIPNRRIYIHRSHPDDYNDVESDDSDDNDGDSNSEVDLDTPHIKIDIYHDDLRYIDLSNLVVDDAMICLRNKTLSRELVSVKLYNLYKIYTVINDPHSDKEHSDSDEEYYDLHFDEIVCIGNSVIMGPCHMSKKFTWIPEGDINYYDETFYNLSMPNYLCEESIMQNIKFDFTNVTLIKHACINCISIKNPIDTDMIIPNNIHINTLLIRPIKGGRFYCIDKTSPKYLSMFGIDYETFIETYKPTIDNIGIYITDDTIDILIDNNIQCHSLTLFIGEYVNIKRGLTIELMNIILSIMHTQMYQEICIKDSYECTDLSWNTINQLSEFNGTYDSSIENVYFKRYIKFTMRI